MAWSIGTGTVTGDCISISIFITAVGQTISSSGKIGFLEKYVVQSGDQVFDNFGCTVPFMYVNLTLLFPYLSQTLSVQGYRRCDVC